jgi:hypothetical protein
MVKTRQEVIERLRRRFNEKNEFLKIIFKQLEMFNFLNQG